MLASELCGLLLLSASYLAGSVLFLEEEEELDRRATEPIWERGADVRSSIKSALHGHDDGQAKPSVPALHLINVGLGNCVPAAHRLHTDADWINVFDELHTYTEVPQAIKNDPRLKRHWDGRGVGFWVWKPMILLTLMQEDKIKDGDVAVYMDSGCELGNASAWVHILSPLRNFDLVTFSLTHHETTYTPGDVFKKVGMNMFEDKSMQVCATYFALRRNAQTLKFLHDWAELASDYNLISLEAEKGANAPDFAATRSDQSLFSVLVKSSCFTQMQYPLKAIPELSKGDSTLPYFTPGLRTLSFNDIGYPPDLRQFPFGASRNRYGGDAGMVKQFNPID